MINHIALFIYNNTRNIRALGALNRVAGALVYRSVRRNYPLVRGERESVYVIVKQGVSVGRFGDGEFRLCRNRGIRCQPVSPGLTRRLNEVLHSMSTVLRRDSATDRR